MVKAYTDLLRSTTLDNDLATIPAAPRDFLEQAKHLAEGDLQFIQNQIPLTPLEQEWISLHNKYGHMSFNQMDRLVQNSVSPDKLKKLRG